MEYLEVYYEVIKILDKYLIYGLAAMVVVTMLVRFIFKDRYRTEELLNLIRWIIIGYTIITLIHYIYSLVLKPEIANLSLHLLGGSNKWKIILIFIAQFSPLSLFYKKIATNIFFLLLMAVLMKLTWYISGIQNIDIFFSGIMMTFTPITFIRGSVVAVVFLILLNLFKRKSSNTA